MTDDGKIKKNNQKKEVLKKVGGIFHTKNHFQKCSGLTSVTIPNSVTSIGSYAFFVNTMKLKEVISKIENPFNIETQTFGDDIYNNATLYVPNGTINKYKSMKGWNTFVHILEGFLPI